MLHSTGQGPPCYKLFIIRSRGSEPPLQQTPLLQSNLNPCNVGHQKAEEQSVPRPWCRLTGTNCPTGYVSGLSQTSRLSP